MLVSGVPQSDSVIHIRLCCSDSFPLYIIARYWIKFPVLYSRCLLFIYFICSNVYLFTTWATGEAPIHTHTHTHTHTYLLFSHSVTFNFFATQWTVAHQAPPSIDCPGKNTGVGNHFLLHGIFLTQGSNSVSCIGRQILYHWAMREAHIHGCVCVFKVKITHTHTHTFEGLPRWCSGK